LYLEQDYYS